MKEEIFWILLAKKITGEATIEELDQLSALISENYERGALVERMQQIWNSTPPPSIPKYHSKAEDAYLSLINKIAVSEEEEPESLKKEVGFSLKRWLYAAAIMLFVGFSGMLYLNQDKATDNQKQKAVAGNKISIDPGSKTRVLLPDGSQVWVNSGTQIIYQNDFNGKTREIELKGEAYFDVVKDAERPFIVHTSGIDIKVLGTAFNVKAYPTDPTIEATLLHGSIEVINNKRPNDAHLILKPHEKLVYQKELEAPPMVATSNSDFAVNIKPLKTNLVDSELVETAWVYNKLAFEDESLRQVADKMERWYDIEITIESEKLENVRISGSFVNESLEEAMKELQFLMPLAYTIKKDKVVITKK